MQDQLARFQMTTVAHFYVTGRMAHIVLKHPWRESGIPHCHRPFNQRMRAD
jgi:hypothetical protein